MAGPTLPLILSGQPRSCANSDTTGTIVNTARNAKCGCAPPWSNHCFREGASMHDEGERGLQASLEPVIRNRVPAYAGKSARALSAKLRAPAATWPGEKGILLLADR